MDFNPTTTRTAILANNTSASAKFLGWPNGVPAPSAIGKGPLGVPQKLFFHGCFWWDTDIVKPDGTISKRTNTSHPDIGIRSYDPTYCALAVADMKSRGAAGCIPDWYGPGSWEDKSLLVMKPEFEKQGQQFAICADKGIHGIDYSAASTDAQRTTVLLNALAYARKTYFGSPAYLHDGGKPVILFFGFSTADFDWTTIRKALADCKLIFRWEYQPTQYSDRWYADGYFGWTDVSETWLANLKSHAPGKLIFGGLNPRFNSSILGAPVYCKWGSGKIIDGRGGLRWVEQLAMWAKHPEVLYLSGNTYTDDQEGSAIEPGIASGFTLTLAFDDATNTLSWADPGAAFDHLTLYVSKDGENLMPVADAIHGVTQVPLAGYSLPVGPWTFVLAAVGKNSIQNLVSNPVTVQEFVDWK